MDNSVILEQIFDTGYATISFDVIPGKLNATIRNLTGEDYIAIDDIMIDKKGSQNKIFQLYGLYRLAFALLKYKNITFDNVEESYKMLSKLSLHLVNKLIKEQDKFEEAVKNALKGEEIEENFSEKADLQTNQELS